MNAKDVLRQMTESAYRITGAYVSDIDGAGWLVGSVPGTNHISWQVGHLLAGTHHMLTALGQPGLTLPDGFAEAHAKEMAACDDAQKFATKERYLALMEEAKAATLSAIDATPDSQLDAPGPEFLRSHVPTVGATLMMARVTG